MSTRASRVPIRIACAVGVLFFAGVLVPYAVIGETWGMLWIYATMPVSMPVEREIGIGDDSYGLIALVSAVCAAGWAAIAYVVARGVQALVSHAHAGGASRGPERPSP